MIEKVSFGPLPTKITTLVARKKKKDGKKLNSETENNMLPLMQQAAGGDAKEKRQKIKQEGRDSNKWKEGRGWKRRRETRQERGQEEKEITNTQFNTCLKKFVDKCSLFTVLLIKLTGCMKSMTVGQKISLHDVSIIS